MMICGTALAQAPPNKGEPPPGEKKTTGEPPGGLTPDPKERATKLAQRGAEYAGNGQYQEAAAKFEESLRIFPLTDVYFNLAYCYEQLGQWKGCTQNYKEYVKRYQADHEGADPAEIASIKRSIEKCREVAQPPIEVTSSPGGARVSLGTKTKVIGTTPLKQKLDPGTYKLFVILDGYTPVETQIAVQAKQPGKFHFDLRKEVKSGRVQIKVNVRGATIYIDGKNFGLSPYTETPELEIGSHQVVVKKDRYNEVTESFIVKNGETTRLSYGLFLRNPPPSWRSYLGWASVSIGAIATAGGVVAYKFAEDQFNDTDDFDQLVLLQNLGYGLGGSLIGVGAVLLIWEALSDSVDKADVIETSAPPVIFGAAPTPQGFFFTGGMRF